MSASNKYDVIIIIATDLREIVFCKRRLWLDIHGPLSERDIPSEALIIRFERGIAHEQRVHAAISESTKEHRYSAKSWDDAVKITKKAMTIRAPEIIGACLEVETTICGYPVIVRGRIDRLVLDGDVYFPIEIKENNNVKEQDKLQLDCYIWLLGQIQRDIHKGVFLMGKNLNPIEHNYDEVYLMSCLEMIVNYHVDREIEPDIYIDSRCNTCWWCSSCRKQAEETHNLSLLSSLRKESFKELLVKGIKDLNAFVKMDVEELRNIKGIKKTAEQFQAQARALIEKRHVFYRPIGSHHLTSNAWYMDTEYDPKNFEVWAIGWCRYDETRGVILVNDKIDLGYLTLDDGLTVNIVKSAKDAWDLFIVLVGNDDEPIFYWSADLRPLKQSVSQVIYEKIKSRFFDLHKDFIDTVQLPIYKTSIKDVATYLKFKWVGYADWSLAFMDYKSWIDTQDEDKFSLFCQYQINDVKSLYVVRKWMISETH